MQTSEFKYGSKWNDDTYNILIANGSTPEQADQKCKELMGQERDYGVQHIPVMHVAE